MAAQDKKIVEMKEEIAMYRAKKDYYDILGVSKSSPDADIKKAYKRLALRFHPDKNKVQGAQEIFSKVSNAYSTLMDPQKRGAYDRYGPEEDRAPQYRPRYNQRYTNPEDLFEEIFRGQFNNGNFHYYSFNMGGPRRGAGGAREQHQHNQSGFPLYYCLFFIFIFYILPGFFGPNQAYHSLQSSSVYRYKMKTSVLETPYFVRQDFFQDAKNDVNLKKNVQETVDAEFLIRLKKQCDQVTYQRKRYQYKANQYSPGAYRSQLQAQAKQVDMSSCSMQRQLYQNHSDYIQNLFYYY